MWMWLQKQVQVKFRIQILEDIEIYLIKPLHAAKWTTYSSYFIVCELGVLT